MKKMFDPYKKIQQKKDEKEPLLLFPNIKKEINGKKYNYGGEYPFNKHLMYKLRKTMNGNGYDVHFQKRNQEGTFIVWWIKKAQRRW